MTSKRKLCSAMHAFVMTVHFLGSRCMYLARTQNLLTKMPTAFSVPLRVLRSVCNYNSVHNQRVLWMDMASSIMLSEKTSVQNILSAKIVQNVLSQRWQRTFYPQRWQRTFYIQKCPERSIPNMVANVLS